MAGRGEARGWQSTAIAAALGVVGMAMDLAIGRSIAGMPWWPNAVSMGVSSVLLILLLAGFRRPRFVATAFVVVNLSVVAALWVTNTHYAQLPAWVPFRPHQLGVLGAAILAPAALWAGVLSVALF